MDPVILCFDVRYETLSFIRAPRDVVVFQSESILIEYKGKLASIVRELWSFSSFDLWILEDVEKHDWSKQTFELPFPLVSMTSPGTNKAGEIIFAPDSLPKDVQPFYIVVDNVERQDIRRVRLQGIADNQEFRRRYGLIDRCCVSISPQHVESIASI
ncbi:F-box associated domain type 3 [Arabidopsis suecica]|uniref:F-box associated domain type 3 n=1 Tax=Arabidopsis suecica TaxID=45249 RepID=A0A8T2CKD4_ARASU|nr:F-box associated domain type 3 [Arabidopsis suecica]